MNTICDSNECTACGACLNICKHSAISMKKGINGHLFPIIEESKCVGCLMCQKVCPNNSVPEYHTPSKVYIATAQDSEEARNSTSAGIASALSRYIIKKGGVVYGCSGVDCQHVRHMRIANEGDLYQLKGSKYVQSDTGLVFSQILKDLLTNIPVIFIGTPCQVAGLKSYLRKDYSNLYTIDLVCHGVPSQQIFSDALRSHLPDVDFSDKNVFFRKKENGKSIYGLFVTNKNGQTLYRSVFPKNDYIVGFLYGLFYRESCYQCHYTRPERVSDITLGDYWDRENKKKISNKALGLSMLIINTKKGKNLIDTCGSLLNLVEGDYSDFIKRNGQLHHPIKKHENYDSFISNYQNEGFALAAKNNLEDEYKRIKKAMLINAIANVVYKIPGMKGLKQLIIK